MKSNKGIILTTIALLLSSLATVGMVYRYEGSFYLKGYGIDLRVKGKPTQESKTIVNQESKTTAKQISEAPF